MESNFDDELYKLRHEINRAEDLRKKWNSTLLPTENSSNSNVTLNAGGSGIAIWICVTACLLMIVYNVTLSGRIQEQADDIRALQEDSRSTQILLSAIWVKAPYLKPQENDYAGYNPYRYNPAQPSTTKPE